MTDEQDWPDPNDGEKPDIQLDNNHTLTWSRYEGELVGGVIRHTSFNERGYCEAAFWLRGNGYSARHKPNGPEWILTGGFETPSFSPSFACFCGESHGFVRNGKWIKA
jgi:hypothetical protein